MFSATETDILLRLEVMFDEFRRQHGIGNGRQNREKFVRILAAQCTLWSAEQDKRQIKLAYT